LQNILVYIQRLKKYSIQAMGIPESLIRYSTGIEDVRDLVDDLDHALAKLK